MEDLEVKCMAERMERGGVGKGEGKLMVCLMYRLEDVY